MYDTLKCPLFLGQFKDGCRATKQMRCITALNIHVFTQEQINGTCTYNHINCVSLGKKGTSNKCFINFVILYLWIGIPTFRSYVGLNLLFKPGGNDFQVNQARWPAWPEIPRENDAKKTSRNIVT